MHGVFRGFGANNAPEFVNVFLELFAGGRRPRGMNKHAPAQSLLPLPVPPADNRISINSSVWFVDSDGYRVVFWRHEPLYRVALGDEVHLRLVAVSLRQSQLVTQAEICRAFGHTVSTQARWERQYREHSIAGLVSKKPTGRHCDLDKSQLDFVRRWFRAGVSNRQMAKNLGVGESTIRRALRRLRLVRPQVLRQPSLPLDDAGTATPAAEDQTPRESEEPQVVAVEEAPTAAEEAPPSPAAALVVKKSTLEEGVEAASSLSLDRDPHDRSCDRVLARLGLLADAVPLFADWESLPRAGVLLAVPLLVRHGLLGAFAKVYRSIGPAFYGLRTIVLTLFLGALLRIKRPEQWKEYRPAELGGILGLDRAPEVKTIRRKYSRLAAWERGKELMEELARRRIAADEDRVAFLYLDGHVREYHGKFPLFQAKKAQRQVVTPAATDTWVHDAQGEPLLVVTSEANAKLTQVLEPILADVRRLVGEQRRMTVIFDRGGFSPKLFARLIAAGFDVITYRKGKSRKLPAAQFARQGEEIQGTWREYTLRDRTRVRVGAMSASGKKRRKGKAGKRYLWMREVRVLRTTAARHRSIRTARTCRPWRSLRGCSTAGVRRTISSTRRKSLPWTRSSNTGQRILRKGPTAAIPNGSGSPGNCKQNALKQRACKPNWEKKPWTTRRPCAGLCVASKSRTPNSASNSRKRSRKSSDCWSSAPRRPSGLRPPT